MTDVIFDIETNGLQPSKVWMIGEEREGNYREILDASTYTFNKEDTYYAHNGIGFDYPVLHRLHNTPTRQHNQRDTMVLSRLASPSRAGGHALDNWGSTLEYPKGHHPDWSKLSDEMRVYGKRDVDLLSRVKRELDKELTGFSEQSIELEHQVAWIIQDQMDNGWKLDQEATFVLLAELKERKDELEESVHETFRPVAKAIREITPKVKADGGYSKVGLKYLGDDCLALVGGPHTRIEFQEFNLGSRPQIAERLIALGWKPPKYTPKTPKGGGGNPIVDETTLREVTFPEGVLIADFLTVQKRIAMAQSWLDFVEPDGRVRGKVNSNGAITGRMTHYEPNMGQVTSGTKIYGSAMRSCWVARDGYNIVGVDASGLELRLLAHYMNDDNYTQEILHGDVHTANMRAAGLTSRDQAKTFIYAFLYGAGDAKIGSIVGGTAKDGKRLKAKFLANTPALGNLRERVGQSASRGYLKGLDGRRIYVRSSHAALNTLLQGAGAVVMKQALVYVDATARRLQMDYALVGNIHDEIQSEVLRIQAEHFGQMAAQSIVYAGQKFNLRCPMAGEYKIGDNWSQTH